MVSKVLLIIFLILALFYFPWWLFLIALALLTFWLEPPYLLALPSFAFDWLYGSANRLPLALISLFAFIVLSHLIKRLIRVN